MLNWSCIYRVHEEDKEEGIYCQIRPIGNRLIVSTTACSTQAASNLGPSPGYRAFPKGSVRPQIVTLWLSCPSSWVNEENPNVRRRRCKGLGPILGQWMATPGLKSNSLVILIKSIFVRIHLCVIFIIKKHYIVIFSHCINTRKFTIQKET